MDIVLIAVTVVSLAVALAASVLAWRLAQEEKQRSAARVAALSAAAGVPLETRAEPVAPVVAAAAAPWRAPEAVQTVRRAAHAEPAAAALPLRAAPVQAEREGLPVSHGFLGAESSPADGVNPQRWLAAAAVVVAMLLGGFAMLRMSDEPSSPTAAHADGTPLELLSLRHEREGANLAVTGLVRNPPAGTAVERVSAVVLLFDQQGAFVTSATAPIEFRTLTGGEESPFVVKVAAPQAVSRYRVSFRSDGGTLPHVDRRAEQAVSPVALTGAGGVKAKGTDDQD